LPYGLQIRNADDVLIVDTEKRSMEAFAWGSMSIPNRGGVRLDIPAEVEAPIVFIRRPSPFAWIIRGAEKTDSGGRHINWSADRNTTIQYLIAGFRTNAPPAAQTGYGCSVFDAAGRLTFSTNLAYPRFPYRSITLGTIAFDPSNFGTFGMISGGSPAYQHPPFGPNDWLYWNPTQYWSKDSGANWHFGLWFGDGNPEGVANDRVIAVQRIDLSVSLSSWQLGWFSAKPPGTALVPDGLLSCNFLPPA